MSELANRPDGAKLLAAAVKKARYDLRLRQEDVESRRGPSVATLRNIEAGTVQSPRPRTLRALDDALGWSAGTAAALFEGRITEAVADQSPRASAHRPDRVDPTLTKAAGVAPRALGEFIGTAVAVVLMDHAHDEHPDPNIHELAHCVLMLARLGGSAEVVERGGES